MEKCQHNSKIVAICIYESCSAKDPVGCQECMKKYHTHIVHAQYIKIQEIQKLMDKFNVENLVKPKCRQFQELIFSFFAQIKNQIFQSIDIVAKNIVNKIGYPFLSKLNHLNVFKRIKNKEYKKLYPKQVKKFCQQSKKLDTGTISKKDRQLYIQQIRQNFQLVQNFQNLIKTYDQLVRKYYKTFSHDEGSFKKIQDLKKYLYSVLKIEKLQQKQQKLQLKQKDQYKILFTNFQSGLSSEKNLNILEKIKNREYHNFSAQSNPRQNQRNNKIKNQLFQLNPIKKEKSTSLISKQKNLRTFQQDSFDLKEKQIFERKQKLMKMMNSKEISVQKSIQNSLGKHLNSLINPPPQLSFQKNSSEKSHKNFKSERFSQKKRTVDNYFTVQIPKNIERKAKKQNFYQKRINREDSILSLKQDKFLNFKESQKSTEQNSIDVKYKYALKQLPISQSISSQEENFVKFNSIGNHSQKKDSKTNYSSSKLNLNQNRLKKLQSQLDEQKSSYLYLKSFDFTGQEAIKYLKASINCCSKNISAAEYLSFVYLKSDKAKECLDLCNNYLQILKNCQEKKSKVNFINNKSAALNILGRFSECIILLEKQAIHFQHSKMYKNLGDAYFSIGLNEKCQYNYEKAINLDNQFDEAMYNFAACLFTQGNFYGAEIWIRKALQINKKNQQYLTLKNEIKKRIENVNLQHLN